MKCEPKINGHSRALIVSVLLHGLVLLGLGVGTFQGVEPWQGDLVVYLAMPAAVPEGASLATAGAGHETVHEPVQSQSVKQVQPKSMESVPQIPVETPVPEEKPVTDPGVEPAVDDSDKTALLPAKMDPVKLTANETSKENTSQALAVNSQFSILNSQFALLAFAGNPAALGILARDALGHDLVEAQILFLPEPKYPVLSRKRGEEGRVIIQLEISAEGKVLKARVTSSSSYPRLDGAALKAIQGAAFTPATEYGVPVESTTTLAYRFELEGK